MSLALDVRADRTTVVAGPLSVTSAAVGRVQVPQPVYQRLSDRFVFEERGDGDVKGKGVMHTCDLLGRNVSASLALPVEKAPPLGNEGCSRFEPQIM